MLRDVGCSAVLAGHSERRQYHHESDGQVAAKVAQALAHGLTPVLCVGETLEEHEAHKTAAVVARQLGAVIAHCGIAAFERIVVAYEPVWAIGTGRTATRRRRRRSTRSCVASSPAAMLELPVRPASFTAAAS